MSNFETVIYSGDDSIQPKQKEAKKSKPANRVFELRSRHDTPEEAIEELKKYGTYSINKEFETKQGIKVDYRCNQVKRRGPQCASAIHLLYHSTSSSVSLYSTKANHTHTTINEESTKQGIPEKNKKIIDQLAERGHVTAKQILDNLVLDKQSDPDIFIPTILQINNYKNNKINKDIPSAFNFAELSELLGNSSHKPEDDDIPYVINMQIKVDEEDQPEGPLIKNEQFRFAISTKRLLALASKHAITIQADATYNLVWNNNPVMITGITDKDNHFHPIILAVCTNEEFHDYQFLFESYVKGIHDLGKFYSSLDQLFLFNFGIIHTSIPLNLDYHQSLCSCTQFHKANSCKHIIAICSMRSLFETPLIVIPISAETIPIGQKRKKGRPALAKKQNERREKLITIANELSEDSDDEPPEKRVSRRRK